jgi:redox-sensitive bicupin YhaK (pirin superfamily)
MKAGEVAREPLMEAQDDGVDAVGIRLGANAQTQGPVSNGGGQYILVCGGTLLENGKAMAENSLIRVEAGEPAPVLQAGPDGADVLVMQFAGLRLVRARTCVVEPQRPCRPARRSV